jgi:hypothetical protein
VLVRVPWSCVAVPAAKRVTESCVL